MGKDGPGSENKESFNTQNKVKILKLNTNARLVLYQRRKKRDFRACLSEFKIAFLYHLFEDLSGCY